MPSTPNLQVQAKLQYGLRQATGPAGTCAPGAEGTFGFSTNATREKCWQHHDDIVTSRNHRRLVDFWHRATEETCWSGNDGRRETGCQDGILCDAITFNRMWSWLLLRNRRGVGEMGVYLSICSTTKVSKSFYVHFLIHNPVTGQNEGSASQIRP